MPNQYSDIDTTGILEFFGKDSGTLISRNKIHSKDKTFQWQNSNLHFGKLGIMLNL